MTTSVHHITARTSWDWFYKTTSKMVRLSCIMRINSGIKFENFTLGAVREVKHEYHPFNPKTVAHSPLQFILCASPSSRTAKSMNPAYSSTLFLPCCLCAFLTTAHFHRSSDWEHRGIRDFFL